MHSVAKLKPKNDLKLIVIENLWVCSNTKGIFSEYNMDTGDRFSNF
jgi:hypothetical protein